MDFNEKLRAVARERVWSWWLIASAVLLLFIGPFMNVSIGKMFGIWAMLLFFASAALYVRAEYERNESVRGVILRERRQTTANILLFASFVAGLFLRNADLIIKEIVRA